MPLTKTRRQTSKKRVLVVEDNRSFRSACCVALELRGLSPSPTASGERALRMMAEGRWDAMMIDLELPNIDALGIVGALRAHEPTRNVSIIALSRSTSADVLELAHARGCDRVVSREAGPNELAHEIERMVGPSDGKAAA